MKQTLLGRQKEKYIGPVLTTRKVDYSKYIRVRIDDRTEILIKENADPEKAKEKFMKLYKKSFQKPFARKDEGTKYCPVCKEEKDVKEFYEKRDTKDGRDVYCAQCCRDKTTQRRESRII